MSGDAKRHPAPDDGRAETRSAGGGSAAGEPMLFLIGSLDTGGAETQLTRLARELKRRGRSLRVATIQPGRGDEPILPRGPLAASLREAGIDVICLGGARPRALAVLRALFVLLNEMKPATVIAFLFHADLLARTAKFLRPVLLPCLISGVRNESIAGRHGRGSAGERRRELLLRLTRRLPRAIVANSEFARARLLERGVFRADEIRVIPNAIDLAAFDAIAFNDRAVGADGDTGADKTAPGAGGMVSDDSARAALRAEFGVAAGGQIWLAAGRLQEQKDYPTLLRALALVVKGDSVSGAGSDGAGPVGGQAGMKLVVAGEGRLRGELEALSEELGLAGLVSFPGLRRDLPRLMAASDVFLMSSAWEGLPNVLMEACAAGLPLIATDVGGVRELLTSGENGLIVPPGDTRALAEAMIALGGMTDEDRDGMGRIGRTRVASDFALPGVVDAWEALFTEVRGES